MGGWRSVELQRLVRAAVVVWSTARGGGPWSVRLRACAWPQAKCHERSRVLTYTTLHPLEHSTAHSHLFLQLQFLQMSERARTAAANVGLATAGLLPTNMLGSAVPGRLAMGLPPSGPVQLGPYVAVPGRSLRSLSGPHSNHGRSPTMGTISLASIRSLRPDMDEPPHRFQNTPVRDAPCLVASTSAPS